MDPRLLRSAWLVLVLLLAPLATAGCLQQLEESGLMGAQRDGVFRLTIASDPGTAPDAAPVAAVEQAASYWRERGHDVAIAEDPSDANRVLSFTSASDGHGVGRACVTDRTDITCEIEIGLGDTSCNGIWTPFDQRTLRRIAIHEIGHAMGFAHAEDPEDPMHATLDTSYRTFCELSSGSIRVGSGDWWGLGFNVPDTRAASYDVTVTGPGTVDTCIIRADDWERLATEDVDGWSCETDARQAQGTATLGEGDYRLTVRCMHPDQACAVLYEMGWA